MIRPFALLGAALLAILVPRNDAFADPCQGRVGPETSISGRTVYDPFNAAGIADDYRISITNVGADSCSFGLLFRSRSARPALGASLAYDVTGARGASLLMAAPAGSLPLGRLRAPLTPNAIGVIEFQVDIPRGQFAAPDVYRDSIELELYALGPGGQPVGGPLETTMLAISYTVPRVLSVNLKGGETATTLAFGTLTTGEQRSVAIEARSNETYQLHVSSDNHAALALTPKVPGQNWSVPYTVSLAGQRMDLTNATALRNLPATRPERDASFLLTVTIGDVGRKRAGRYEDVITVEILPAAP